MPKMKFNEYTNKKTVPNKYLYLYLVITNRFGNRGSTKTV